MGMNDGTAIATMRHFNVNVMQIHSQGSPFAGSNFVNLLSVAVESANFTSGTVLAFDLHTGNAKFEQKSNRQQWL